MPQNQVPLPLDRALQLAARHMADHGGRGILGPPNSRYVAMFEQAGRPAVLAHLIRWVERVSNRRQTLRVASLQLIPEPFRNPPRSGTIYMFVVVRPFGAPSATVTQLTKDDRLYQLAFPSSTASGIVVMPLPL